MSLSLSIACSSSEADHRAGPTSSSDETEGCNAIERGRLFPIIGAFFGRDPGPCTTRRSETQYVFEYDADARLVQQRATDDTDKTVFRYDDNLLLDETRTWTQGTSRTTYEYSNEHIRTITLEADGSATGYEYDADRRGYVREVRLLNDVSSGSIPTRYTYEYVSCELQWRVSYDRNDAVNLSDTVKYTYDPAGHLMARTSVTSEETFDYSCW